MYNEYLVVCIICFFKVDFVTLKLLLQLPVIGWPWKSLRSYEKKMHKFILYPQGKGIHMFAE